MNSKENLVKKPKKEDEIEEEIEEIELDDEPKKSTTSSSPAKKRMITMMAIIIGATLILLFILFIMSLFTTKKYDYDQVEEVLVSAAKSYFKDHPDNLPVDDGDIVEIDSSNLVAEGKMKDLSEYVSDTSCAASVQVERSGSEYLYTPYLNCGDSYTTVELYKQILNDNDVVTSGDGLYSTGSGYVYRGEFVNNYVQLDNSLWRIVKVTSDDNVVLIHADGLEYSQPWDDRYNESRFYESGLNTYSLSRIREYLDRIYKNPVKDDGEDILSKGDKARIVSHNACVGKRDDASEAKDNSLECKDLLRDQKMSLLTLSDYMYASLDPNCKNVGTKSCMNYNYLAIDDEWWLITANSKDTSTVFKVDRDGVLKADVAATYSKVRPVIYLNSKILLKGGKGTLEKPYIVK